MSTPFRCDGLPHDSGEALWQSLLYPEGFRARARTASPRSGWRARKTGQEESWPDLSTYRGRICRTASPAHHALVERAIRDRVDHNPAVRQALLATGSARPTHVVANQSCRVSPDRCSLPRAVLAGIPARLRPQLRKGRLAVAMGLPPSRDYAGQPDLL